MFVRQPVISARTYIRGDVISGGLQIRAPLPVTRTPGPSAILRGLCGDPGHLYLEQPSMPFLVFASEAWTYPTFGPSRGRSLGPASSLLTNSIELKSPLARTYVRRKFRTILQIFSAESRTCVRSRSSVLSLRRNSWQTLAPAKHRQIATLPRPTEPDPSLSPS